MANRKNLCALIPTEMHDRVSREREKLGMTNSDYVLKVLTEYYDMMENGGTNMAKNNGKERTLAFPVSEEFFQRVKRYLDRETKRTGRKLTQKDFVIGLIEAKLDEADRADAEAARIAEGSQPADENPATGEPEATENGNGEAAEDSQPADAEHATEEPEDTENGNGEEADENAE